jgi:hypothetical protein
MECLLTFCSESSHILFKNTDIKINKTVFFPVLYEFTMKSVVVCKSLEGRFQCEGRTCFDQHYAWQSISTEER